jgi:hypothetical protein
MVCVTHPRTMPEADGEVDSFLHAVMQTAGERSWTLVLASSPIKSVQPKSAPAVVSELRKRADEVEKNATTGGLFENYQFFTPGIFMAYTAMFFLLLVLYAAVGAISGLEISYGAFEKDHSQKKGQ